MLSGIKCAAQFALFIEGCAGLLYGVGVAVKTAWSASGMHERFDWMDGSTNPIGLIDMLLEPAVSPWIAGILPLLLLAFAALCVFKGVASRER